MKIKLGDKVEVTRTAHTSTDYITKNKKWYSLPCTPKIGVVVGLRTVYDGDAKELGPGEINYTGFSKKFVQSGSHKIALVCFNVRQRIQRCFVTDMRLVETASWSKVEEQQELGL